MGKQRTHLFWTDLARHIRSVVLASAILTGTAYAQDTTTPREFDVPAGRLDAAVERLGEQAGLQIVYDQALVLGKNAGAVKGRLTAAEALKRLLSGTGLMWERINEQSIVLRPAPTSTPPKPVIKPRPAQSMAPEGKVTELAEILVTGTRSLNTDIERTRDDAQPYVVFHRETIERSGATSVDDFLKQRLPMNTTAVSENQGAFNRGNRSQINLRGLGTAQTLILVDGRRTSNTIENGDQTLQPDLNGIPLAAIERIEVLPTTASGIYGGDATGGVINIILRRDYQGSEVKLTWDNTFDTDSAQPRVDLSTGFNLGENTNVMITASRSWGNVLMNRDRDFVEDYRRQAFANNPNLYLPPASPPLGFLPNLRSTDGSDLLLDDGTPLGSSFTHVPAGYAGAGSDGGAALLANAGTYDFGLANSSQGNGGRQALLNAPEITSANLTIRHTLTPRIESFLELAASNNVGRFVNNSLLPGGQILPADAPNNPFQQDLEMQVPLPTQDFRLDTRVTDRRIATGIIVKLPGNWLAEADYVWSRTSLRSADEVYGELTAEGITALADGTLDILRDQNAFPLNLSPYLIRPGEIRGPYETTTRSPTLIFGGPVGNLPGGQPMLNLRLEHRDERFAEATQVFPMDFGTINFPAKSQAVSSAFAELRIPLFSSLNARPGLQELEFQLSARHDRYTIEGATNSVLPDEPVERIDSKLDSTNVTAGFRWKPIEDLVLRASYGTGFLPPNVNQLVPSIPFLLPGNGFFLDPRRGNTPVGDIEYLFGGSPDLKPEESESFSAGLVLTPRFLLGARLSVDYTRIEKTDNISGVPGSVQGLLDNEARFPDRVTRGHNLPGDPLGWAGPVVAVDDTLINIARAEVEAYDLQLDYARETRRWGTFNVFAIATWQTHYRTQLLDDLPIVENVGFQGGGLGSPLKLKANVGATWQYRRWTLGWLSRYFDSYHPYPAGSSDGVIASNLQTQGAAKVKHQIYHDLTAQYAFDGSDSSWQGRLRDGLAIQFGIRNVFNEKPPRELDHYSPYGDPRLSSYWLTLRKSF